MSNEPNIPPSDLPPPLLPESAPIPIAPLSYATPPPPLDAGSLRYVAHASWLAPALILAMLILAIVLKQHGDTSSALLGCGMIILLLAGLSCAWISFRDRRGRSGIVAPATVGLTLNLMIVLLTVGGIFLRARQGTPMLSATVSPAPTSAQQQGWTQQEVVDMIGKYPGWVGISKRVEGTIVIVQWNDDAAVTRKFKSAFASDFELVSVAVTGRTEPTTIDPASLELHYPNFQKLTAIPPRQVAATARSSRDTLMAALATPHTEVGNSQLDTYCFFSPAADFTTATSITLLLNGQRIVIPGKYLSVAQKDVVLKRTPGAPPGR